MCFDSTNVFYGDSLANLIATDFLAALFCPFLHLIQFSFYSKAIATERFIQSNPISQSVIMSLISQLPTHASCFQNSRFFPHDGENHPECSLNPINIVCT